jgi:hypothetical protein
MFCSDLMSLKQKIMKDSEPSLMVLRDFYSRTCQFVLFCGELEYRVTDKQDREIESRE